MESKKFHYTIRKVLIISAQPCAKISPPMHGSMTCTGYVTDKWCEFSCDTGFDLNGSARRMCQPSATWSGEPVTCTSKYFFILLKK